LIEENKVTVDKLIAFHARIINFDPNEIMSNRNGACRHCYGDGFARQWREPEYIEALKTAERNNDRLPDYAGGFGYSLARDPNPDCPMCDGRGVPDPWVADTTKLSETARAGYHGLQQTKDGIKVLMADKQKSAEALAKILGLDKTDVRVSGDVALLAAAVNMETTDPVEASRIYQRIMTNSLAPG
jgi:phage terminase small subunit